MNEKILAAFAVFTAVVMCFGAIAVVAESSDATSRSYSWINIADGSIAINVGDSITITDSGDDELSVTINSKPSWTSFSNDILTGTATSSGTYTLSFYLNDTSGEGMTGSHSTTITVNPTTTTHSYTLIYNANGGSGAPSSQTATSTSTSKTFTISSTEPTRDGYLFDGWATSSTATSGYYGTNTSTITLTISSGTSVSKTLYAVWVEDTNTPITYTLSYDTNGGTPSIESETATTTALYYDFTISSTEPTLENYTFLGWSQTVDYAVGSGTASYHPGDTIRITTSLGLHAVWQSNTCVISYNANGGSGTVSNMSVTLGETFTLPASDGLTNDSGTFLGWSLTADGETIMVAGTSQTATASVTYYAIWGNDTAPIASFIYSASGLTVYFTSNSIAADSWDWSFGDDIGSTSENPKHTYSTRGTYSVSLSVTNATTVINSYTVQVTVSPSASSYTITFDSNGGDTVEAISDNANSEVTLPTATYTGYIFAGWYYDDNFVGNAGSTYTLTGDITLTAKWAASGTETYIVTFMIDDQTNSTQTVISGGVATFYCPQITDVSLVGWYNSDTESYWNFNTTITEDVTLTAVFKTQLTNEIKTNLGTGLLIVGTLGLMASLFIIRNPIAMVICILMDILGAALIWII